MMIRKALALFIPLVFAAFVGPASAQVERVTLRVDGLACPFCAYGVEKKLKNLEGFRSLNVRINEGKVMGQWRPDKPLDLPALDDAVHKAGFTLRGVSGSFVGTVAKEDGRYFLVLPAPVGQRFYLYNPGQFKTAGTDSHRTEGTPEALRPSTRARLDSIRDQGKPVRITGPVHSHDGEALQPGLGVEELEVVSPTPHTSGPAKGEDRITGQRRL